MPEEITPPAPETTSIMKVPGFRCRVCGGTFKLAQAFRKADGILLNLCKTCRTKKRKEQEKIQRHRNLIANVEAIQETLMKTHDVRESMSTVMQFLECNDAAMGGAAGIAARYVVLLDNLMAEGKNEAALKALMQLQKMRLLLERMNIEEDFTQMDLEQKRAKLQFEMGRYVAEMPANKRAEYFQGLLRDFTPADRTAFLTAVETIPPEPAGPANPMS